MPDYGERSALLFVITKWNSTCPDADNVGGWDGMLKSWYNEITDNYHGSKAFWGDGVYKNGDIGESYFVDPDLAGSWGADDENDRLDDDDVVMVGLHGTHDTSGGTSPWYGYVRVNESGSGPDCSINQNRMDLDMDLEFLHLSSCHSLCEPYEGGDHWDTSFTRLHQVNGFYGLMWISDYYYSGNYNDFADDAFDIAIADSWLDNLYDNNVPGSSNVAQCPVTMAGGSSTSDASTRICSEEYDYVYSDPSNTKFVYLILGGCDPSGHNP